MLGGEAVADPNFSNIVHDIALLHSLGVRLVLVHGSRPQIAQRLQEKSLCSRLHHHLRVTDQETLGCVVEAAAVVRTEIEARLSLGLPNTPMAGSRIRVVSGNFVTAKPVGVLDGVDMAHTGEVRRLEADAVSQQLDAGNIVLLSHLGYSPTSELFNLSVEDVAICTAATLAADKLIMFGQDQGVTDSAGQLRSELVTRKAERLVTQYLLSLNETENPHTELSRNLEAAVDACRQGVKRCHLISYKEDGALLGELFTRDGSGTMVLEESYEQLREATVDDVGAVLELIHPLEKNGTLVRRSREVLENEIERFTLIERDAVVIGCAALYPFLEEGMAELACVVVDPEYSGGARGDALLHAVEQQALESGISKIFVLTTKTAHWFIERGFVETDVSALPNEKKALFNLQRNSKVFFKSLA